jgi:hypothetical protein
MRNDEMGTKHELKSGSRIPAADLEVWANHEWTGGIQIDRMSDLEVLVVQTLGGSTFEITVLRGSTGEILVKGGSLFPETRAVLLSGASIGGSFLKVRGIYTGLSMEFHLDDTRIITSPVRSIEWVGHGVLSGI